MKLPFRLSISKEQLIDICFLLAVSVAFLGFSLYQIDLPGLYGDELDKLHPTVSLLTGQTILPLGGWHVTIFNYRVLLTFNDRIGPVLSYLPMPFILLFDYTPLALRLTSVICAWLTLIFAYYGAKLWCGASVARFGIALTAVNPVFVFTQRMGYYSYGPVTLFITISFFFLARYISNKGARNLWFSAAFAGIAVETALQAVFVLIPMALLAMLFLKETRPRPREIVIALFIFMVISLPILLMGMKTGAMFERIGWSGNSPGSFTISGFLDTLSYEVRCFTGMLGGLDGVQVMSIGKDIKSLWMHYVFWLSVPALLFFFMFARDKVDFIRRDVTTLLITLCGLFFTGFLLTDRITYQLIVLWPFAILAIGSGLAYVYQRFRMFRPITVALVCLLVISQASVLVQAHQLLAQNGGRVFTSPQIYSLAKYLEERPSLHPVAMDWGLQNQIYYLTRGEILPDAIHGWWPKDGFPPDKFNEAVSQMLENPNNIFIFFAQGEGVFDRYPQVEKIAKNSNITLHLKKVFYERDGSIVYRLYMADFSRIDRKEEVVANLSWQRK
jgi:hypothetical protein